MGAMTVCLLLLLHEGMALVQHMFTGFVVLFAACWDMSELDWTWPGSEQACSNLMHVDNSDCEVLDGGRICSFPLYAAYLQECLLSAKRYERSSPSTCVCWDMLCGRLFELQLGELKKGWMVCFEIWCVD